MTRPHAPSRLPGLAVVVVAVVIVFGCGLFAAFASAAEEGKKESPMPAAATQPAAAAEPLTFTVKDIDGNEYDLSKHRGQVVMIVNVASKCGMTPQYEGLQKLYDTYKDRGLVVVGFPANNFKGQEPGTDADIKTFCTSKYGVTFPMMSKISVKGDDQHPLYKQLTDPSTNGPFAGEIGWNFTKFLVGRDGKVVARFDSKTKPDDAKVIETVETALGGAPQH
jgi:glutathione peroxidase